MASFKSTKLSKAKSVELPFSDDIEDYFTIKLKKKEVVIDQFSGEILSEIEYPMVKFFSNLSLNLHTGKGSILWSIILAIASANILFFIYSGFAMTLKRRAVKLKNKSKRNDATYVILVGSENGGTLAFATTTTYYCWRNRSYCRTQQISQIQKSRTYHCYDFHLWRR